MRLELPGLQRTQERRLRRQRKLADFIQQDPRNPFGPPHGAPLRTRGPYRP